MNSSIVRYILGHVLKIEAALMVIPVIVGIIYREQAIKDTSYILAKMLSENAVEWIRGRVEQDPVALMEKAIAAVDGVGQVLLNNLNQNLNNK